MNTAVQLAYRPTTIDRIAWFLTGIGVRTKVTRTPHLGDIAYHLLVKAMTLRANATAHELQPILERAAELSPGEWASLGTHPGGRRVVVDNEFLKVVLIRWEAGVECARHYHPNGGGLIMVLEGAIRESRFLNDFIPAPYDVRDMRRQDISYIDDQLGPHVVANPHERAAVTLHAYLKYRPLKVNGA